VSDAIRAIEAYQRIPIRIVDVELDEAVKLADKLNIYAYIIRCAIKYKSPLLSLDKSLLNSASLVKTQIIKV
jgi:predicted nucleic acid-binding protein